jgi:hypothetical protein
MEIADYRQIYMNFHIAVEQTHLMSLVAGDALKDFPNRLPTEAILGTYVDLRDMLDKFIRQREKGRTKPNKRAAQYQINVKNPLAGSSIQLLLTQVLAGKNPKELDFDRVLYAQELVMLIAHLDAFLGDSLRAICRTEPKVLHSNKQMRWDIILKQGNWENLMESMIEVHTYEFGWKSIRERLVYLIQNTV